MPREFVSSNPPRKNGVQARGALCAAHSFTLPFVVEHTICTRTFTSSVYQGKMYPLYEGATYPVHEDVHEAVHVKAVLQRSRAVVLLPRPVYLHTEKA